MKKDLKNLNQIIKSFKILGKENMLKRVSYIYQFQKVINFEIQAQVIFDSINSIVKDWEEKMANIVIMKEYNNIISKENENSNEINNKLTEYMNTVFNYKLDYLNSPESSKEYSKYIDQKLLQLAKEVIQLKESQVFIKIFNKIKKNEKKNISEKAIKEFKKIKNLFFDNEKNIIKELKSNDKLKYLIEIGSKDEAILIQEIDWLINYFNINNFSHRDFLIGKINIYIKNQSLFQVVSGILQFLDIFKDNFDTNTEDFIKNEKTLSDIINIHRAKDLITIEQFEKNVNYLEKQFKISKYNQELFNRFFIQVYLRPNCIKFLKNKKAEDVKYLKEFLLDNEKSQLKEEDVNDFILVVLLFEKQTINVLDKKLSFFDMVENIMIELSKKNNLEKSFFNYLKIFNHIEILLNKYLEGSKEWIKKMKFIFDYSDLLIKKEKLKSSVLEEYKISGSYKEITSKNNNNINLDNNDDDDVPIYPSIFQEELDSIFQKIFITKIPDIYKELSKNFISLYKNMKKLITALNELDSNGYHKDFEISIHIEESKILCEINGKEESLNNIVTYLFTLNNTISEKLMKLYEQLNCIRFFYPKQLINIYNDLILNNNQNKEKSTILLNIYFNNVFKKFYQKQFIDSYNKNIEKSPMLSNIFFSKLKKISSFDEKDKKNFNLYENDNIEEYCEVIKKINEYILYQLESNEKTLDDIYKINTIKINEKPLHSQKLENNLKKKKNKYEGIFFRIAKNNEQEIEVLNIFNYLTNNLPINSCFFYCSKNTKQEELKYFLIKTFLCNYYVLFSVINIDLINNKLKRYFMNLLKRFYKKYKKSMKCCLLLMFNGKDEELHKMLLRTKFINSLPDYIETLKEFKFDPNYKISLINSKSCGYGKSLNIITEKNNEIVNKKTKEKVNYIYFPIGGNFDKIKLSQRFDELPEMSDINKKYAIHFDITQTKDIEFLNEFFFKLLILRKYDIYAIKYFDTNVEIIIEIPNDFTNYINEIKIFKKLKKQTIKQISQINPSDDLLFVSKILTVYENNDILKSQKELEKILLNLKLSQDKCENIILKYIKSNKLTNPNFYQINIFIKILSEEFKKFYNCQAFYSDILFQNASRVFMKSKDANSVKNLRTFIINSLIQITNLFILSPYESLIKDQEFNQKILDENEQEREKIINKELEININSFSFDNIHPSLIIFNEDGFSSTIIATCGKEEEEFKNLEKLYKTQGKDKLKNFKEYSDEDIFDKLLDFLNVSGYFKTKEQKDKILGTYVYTPDNFIKVILILMRIRMKIPVILMGETGCGKTKLIEMASQLINRGESKIHKLNIHAGIQDNDIINFFERLDTNIKNEDDILYYNKVREFENLSKEAKNSYLKNSSKVEILLNYQKEIKERKIWIFFDEINTCNSMGLLTEIMCKNTIYGKPLDNRYVFIAACNPYRVSKKENFLLNVLYKKNQKKKNLVYTVNPLPMSLMNFVFNFGSLKPDDESAYIKSMVEKIVNRFFDEKTNYKIKEYLINVETQCVKLCQNFLKKNNDASIVSLREVNRFNIFLEFFISYLLERKQKRKIIEKDFELDEIYNFYSSKSEMEIFYYALNLSLYICYYLRLPDKNTRLELASLINEKKYFQYNFLRIPEMELNFLIKNFIIPEGIAKNKSLKENLFLLFFCIINKIPLIICGKPGRSKTLSFQILQNSMKGVLSPNSFCQKYPELLSFKIQGSLNTTSEEIINTFKRGRTNQERNPDKLWVIFMDEMGLAEISENNPLKVMHAELEQEQNKIAFVGISNWFIDASKMNRVIYNVDKTLTKKI